MLKPYRTHMRPSITMNLTCRHVGHVNQNVANHLSCDSVLTLLPLVFLIMWSGVKRLRTL